MAITPDPGKVKIKRQTISAKDAARAAAAYYQELTGDRNQVRLEEIGLSDDRAQWIVTISHLDPDQAYIALGNDKRLYKTLTVDASNGEVLGMRIKHI